MAQMTVRQIDDARYEQLRRRAKLLGVSAEALAREAIHSAAKLTAEEKLQIVAEAMGDMLLTANEGFVGKLLGHPLGGLVRPLGRDG